MQEEDAVTSASGNWKETRDCPCSRRHRTALASSFGRLWPFGLTASVSLAEPGEQLGPGPRGQWHIRAHCLRLGSLEGGRWKVYVLETVMPVDHDLFEPGQVHTAVPFTLASQYRVSTAKTFLHSPFREEPSSFLCPRVRFFLLSRQAEVRASAIFGLPPALSNQ